MIKMRRLKRLGAHEVAAGAALAASTARGSPRLQAADCPRKDALGTSRILSVDTADHAARRPEELSADAAARPITRSC